MGEEEVIVRKMSEALLALDSGLTEWEVNFVESVARQLESGTTLSDRQVKKLEELHERYCE